MKRLLVVAGLVVVALGLWAWYHLRREVPQPAWISATPRDDFFYGAIGTERTAGLPFWVWLVLPRLCPDHVPGPGGYAALGRPWEQGREMPVGLAKKTVGYVRVGANCALCHVVWSRPGPDAVPLPVVAGPGQAADLGPLQSFFSRCARDPRYNADDILSEINMATKLSIGERLLYRYVLIPRTRRALVEPSVLLDADLQAHRRRPEVPFGNERLKGLAAWLQEQRRAPR